MNRQDVISAAEAYLEKNWPAMVQDIDRLVRIESVEDLEASEPGAPFGPGPKAALTEALSIAEGMGFSTCDVDGYMGYADLAGAGDKQIGIIGHMDVVPAGPGWHHEPYAVTEKEGFLIGRGVLDDKGPSLMALHAMKCLADLGLGLNHTIRFLFGVNEESGMNDVPYYRERFADPAFLFTPDAEFPVCHGEKGGFDARITSGSISDPVIVEFAGGAAPNAVPGVAHAIVRADAAVLPEAESITVTDLGNGAARIEALGKSAHASMPENGVNAIELVVRYLLANDLCSADERAFLEFQEKLLGATDGSGVGLKSEDDYFGPLTVIGGTVAMQDGKFVQTMDSRFPTSITEADIAAAMRAHTDPIGATFEVTLVKAPFLVKPDTPEIQTLLRAYNEITGADAEPFTMGGGTYARVFSCAASFGPEMPWLPVPDWAGGIHGPGEAVSVDQLKTAFKIYALALYDLEQLDLA